MCRYVQEEAPLGMRFVVHDLMDLRMVRDAFIYKTAPALTGADNATTTNSSSSSIGDKRVPVNSKDPGRGTMSSYDETKDNRSIVNSSSTRVYDQLVAQGHRWSQHILESPVSWALALIHIMATVVAGWPIIYTVVHFVVVGAGAPDGGVLDTTLGK